MFSKKAIQEILPSKVGIHQGIIVGYPLGEHKRISIVNFTLDGDDNEEDDDDAIRAHSKDGTRRGSSGSPVMIRKSSLLSKLGLCCRLRCYRQ